MTETRGLFWDVDGTLAETERNGHRTAFNAAFAELGFNWLWDENVYGDLLKISGGEERLCHWLSRGRDGQGPPPGAPANPHQQQRLASRLQRCKQQHYQRLVAAGAVSPRPGVLRLIRAVAAVGWQQWIVTTSSRRAVEALFASPAFCAVGAAFSGWICGEDVRHKKPHPQAYRLALDRSGLPREQVVVIEDSAAGLAAAQQAGLPCLVTPGHFNRQHHFPGAMVVLSHLGELPAQPLSVLDGPAWLPGEIGPGDLQRLRQEV